MNAPITKAIAATAITSFFALGGTVGCSSAINDSQSTGNPAPTAEASVKTESFLAAGGKGDSIFNVTPGSAKAAGILELVNTASHPVLDDDVSLDVRAADNIVAVRAKGRIATLQDLDDISWVGKRAFRKLYVFAEHNGYFPEPDESEEDEETGSGEEQETVQGVIPGSKEARGILAVANKLSFTKLDDDVALDRRAARNIVDERKDGPIETVQELDAISYVAGQAFEKLFNWAKEHGYLDGNATPSTCSGDSSCPDGTTCSNSSGRCVPNDCSWKQSFADKYGQPWNRDNLVFHSNGEQYYGYDSLSIDAAESRPKFVVHEPQFNTVRPVDRVEVLDDDSQSTIATIEGQDYLYGLRHAAWSEANGYSSSVETVLLRQLTREEPTRSQNVAQLERLLQKTVNKLSGQDREDFKRAKLALVQEVKAGSISMDRSHGHAIRWSESRQYVNGYQYEVQFSNSYGMDPEVGVRKLDRRGNEVWGPIWIELELQPSCGGWRTLKSDDSTYYRWSREANWSNAEQTCQKLGGHLATLESSLDEARARSLSARKKLWIGLNDRAEEGSFVWSSGAAVGFTNWRHSSDSGSDARDCVEHDVDVEHAYDYAWRDVACDNQRAFVCQVPSN